MVPFLFILLLLGAAFIYIYFSKKVETQRKQVFLLSRQNHTMKVMYPKNITIKYSTPEYRYGYTTENCSIFIAPMESTPCVCKLQKHSSLIVMDCANISDENWYEVSVQSKDRINNKGWIKASKIIFPEGTKAIAPE